MEEQEIARMEELRDNSDRMADLARKMRAQTEEAVRETQQQRDEVKPSRKLP